MGSKNISIRDGVYEALEAAKGEDESFSDVIERLLAARAGEHPFYRLAETLDDESADRVRENARRFRESVEDGMGPGQ